MFDFNSIKEILTAIGDQYIIISNPVRKGLKVNKFQKIKLSNLISALSINTSTTPYLVYSALISQSGTSAPTVTVLQNTIGTLSWKRTSIGFYEGILSNTFPAAKTFLLIQKPFVVDEGGGVYVSKDVAIKRVSASSIGVYSEVYDPVAKQDFLADNVLNAVAIEIRVYN